MARARNIKPGFYKNADLAECSVWARLLFPGLWMLADREGRLLDRPKQIKGELLPYDAQDVEPLLRELHRKEFILRYEIDGQRCIQILRFKDHQYPHYSEKPSAIKPPKLPELVDHTSDSFSENVPGNDPSLRPPANLLNPESLELNPESLENHIGADGVQKANGSIPPCPISAIVKGFNRTCPTCEQQQIRTRSRDAHITARWRQIFADGAVHSRDDALQFFNEFFERVRESKFLTGRAATAKPGQPPFVASLGWLMKPENFAKVIEGRYDPR